MELKLRPLLSQRASGGGVDGPYEGVPDHLRGPFIDWLRRGAVQMMNRWEPGLVRGLALRLRVEIPHSSDDAGIWNELVKVAEYDDEVLLDWVDLSLSLEPYVGLREDLEAVLRMGGSAYTVSGDQLELLVPDELRQSKDMATDPPDEVSDELSKAWVHAYGLNPDPSDAWDHAIKAVEACLLPAVCPNNLKANLGNVLGELRAAGTPWKTALSGGTHQTQDAGRLVGMLEFLWPNPDRHGGGHSRAPSLEEAQSVVNLAVTIVQWHRAGCLLTR